MDQFHPVSIAAFLGRKGQDRHFKFPFDPQAAQEAWGMSSGWMSDPEVFQLVQVRLQAAAELLESWPMAGEIGEMLFKCCFFFNEKQWMENAVKISKT